ncbi:MAG TPA: COX15/CtaA family protein [Planctomycetota bacterium]|nr:COX15/CtaA family protein [Planctomycetota bacterium]
MSHPAAELAPSPWPRRLAWATLLAALPLVLFGGTVTTLRAGMAIDGWFVLEPGRGDHFLLAYPLEKWLRDAGTFTEHTHRLFGALVGLLAIAHVACTVALDRRRELVVASIAGLVAICGQGALGGFRVLENSQQLAFLHGSFAQAVFALLALNVVLASQAWRTLPRELDERARGLRALSWLALLAVYAQIVLGAWLRHTGAALPLVLHVVGAFVSVAAVALAARGWKRAAGDSAGRAPLARASRRAHALVGAQALLGVGALVAVMVFSGGFQGAVSTGEMVLATAHVLFGALLLAQCLAGVLWSYRLLAEAGEGAQAPAGLEGAR